MSVGPVHTADPLHTADATSTINGLPPLGRLRVAIQAFGNCWKVLERVGQVLDRCWAAAAAHGWVLDGDLLAGEVGVGLVRVPRPAPRHRLQAPGNHQQR